MEMNVLSDKENVFLKRKEIELEISHDAETPSKADLVKELAAKYSVPEDHVILNYLFTYKGSRKAFAKAKIYEEKPVINAKKSKDAKPAAAPAKA